MSRVHVWKSDDFVDVPAAVRTLRGARVVVRTWTRTEKGARRRPERRGWFETADMAQRRFVAIFMLSCACTKCTSLGEQRVRESIYGRADTDDATYADDGPRTAEGFCSTHVGRVIAVEGKDG